MARKNRQSILHSLCLYDAGERRRFEEDNIAPSVKDNERYVAAILYCLLQDSQGLKFAVQTGTRKHYLKKLWEWFKLHLCSQDFIYHSLSFRFIIKVSAEETLDIVTNIYGMIQLNLVQVGIHYFTPRIREQSARLKKTFRIDCARVKQFVFRQWIYGALLSQHEDVSDFWFSTMLGKTV